MEFLQRMSEFRARSLLAIVTLLWLPNVFRVYCRNLNGFDTYANQLKTFSRQVSNSNAFTTDFLPKIIQELSERQANMEKKDSLKSTEGHKTENQTFSDAKSSSEKVNDFLQPTGEFGDFVSYADSNELHTDSLQSKLNENFEFIKDERKYVKSNAAEKDNKINAAQERKQKQNSPVNMLKDNGKFTISRNSTTKATPSKRGLMDPDTCETETIELDLQFSDHRSTETSSYLLTCTGKAVVNKCEGLCNSSGSPSVNHYDGFQRVGL